ncbi:hypothetical protein [Burkholderia cenocepacia]|nr:hypothetical protein [Burkholderia cenocepacia]
MDHWRLAYLGIRQVPRELIAHHADPNLRDAEGDSAVSLAVNA